MYTKLFDLAMKTFWEISQLVFAKVVNTHGHAKSTFTVSCNCTMSHGRADNGCRRTGESFLTHSSAHGRIPRTLQSSARAHTSQRGTTHNECSQKYNTSRGRAMHKGVEEYSEIVSSESFLAHSSAHGSIRMTQNLPVFTCAHTSQHGSTHNITMQALLLSLHGRRHSKSTPRSYPVSRFWLIAQLIEVYLGQKLP